MSISTSTEYGSCITEDLCKEFGIDVDFRTEGDSLCQFIDFIKDNTMMGSLLKIVIPKGSRYEFYYCVHKNSHDSEKDIIEIYNINIKNPNREFSDLFGIMDLESEDNPDLEEYFCESVFDSKTLDEAKEKILKLKNIMLKAKPEFITIISKE